MTTFTDFAPPPKAPFIFNPTLDGRPYRAVIAWGLFGQRWFLNLYAADGTRIVTTPLTASPDPVPTQDLTWDQVRRLTFVTTSIPHGIKIGTSAVLTVRNVSPDAFNGIFTARAIDPTRLMYDQNIDPGGSAVLQGGIGFDLNLVAGYFSTSTLVYRERSKQFEVTP